MKRILTLVTLLFVVAILGCSKNKTQPVVNPPTDVLPQGFLGLPFKKGTACKVQQGWIFLAKEQAIYRKREHYALDFEAPRGTPVLAAADGLALASYQAEPNGIYQGKEVGFGLGLFVQIWDPEHRVFTMYGHLSGTARDIPYYEPEVHGQYYEPTVVRRAGDQIQFLQTKKVRKGEVIGYVGDSGCYWGYQEKPGYRPDPRKFPSLDGPNLHFMVFDRNAQGEMCKWFDPYGVYGKAVEYNSPFPPTSLWLTSKEGLPLYADESAP